MAGLCKIVAFILSLSMLILLVFAENTNLILNESVELGADAPENWFAGANTVWENEGHWGIHSLGISTSASSGDWRCKSFIVDGNGNYSFSVWVKSSITGDLFRFKIRWFSNPDGTGYISENYIAIKANLTDWKQVNASLTAPSTAKSSDVIFESVGGSGHVLADDFVMQCVDVVPSEASDWFKELFYGSGKWLTLVIMLAIVIAVSTVYPYGGVFFLPLTIFLGIDYLRNIPVSSDFMWGAITMMFVSIYILAMLIKKASK